MRFFLRILASLMLMAAGFASVWIAAWLFKPDFDSGTIWFFGWIYANLGWLINRYCNPDIREIFD